MAWRCGLLPLLPASTAPDSLIDLRTGDWSTYVACDDLAAERRRLAAAVDRRRRTSQDRENVNNVTGRVAVEQQDAMLRALDRPVEPVRATRAVTPSEPLLPAAAVARGASDAPVMAPARVPSVTPMHRRVTRRLSPSAPSAPPLPVAEVIATRAIPRSGLRPTTCVYIRCLIFTHVGGALVRALRGPMTDLLALEALAALALRRRADDSSVDGTVEALFQVTAAAMS